MTHNELCDKYIELSQIISALHTQIKAARDAYDLNPTPDNLAALNSVNDQLNTINAQRAELERLLQQRHCLAKHI